MFNEAPLTVKNILQTRAEMYADHIAVLSPNRPPLTYRALYDHTHQIAVQLHRLSPRNFAISIPALRLYAKGAGE